MQSNNARSKILPKVLFALAFILFVIPFLVEIQADGGLSHFNDPETGWALVILGFLLWPVALICLLVGVILLVKRSRTNVKIQEPDSNGSLVHTDSASSLTQPVVVMGDNSKTVKPS